MFKQVRVAVVGSINMDLVTNAPRFPNIRNPHNEDICYATTNRQKAVKELAEECDLVIVVGSPNSSNSNRLREVAALRGVDAYMVDNAGYLRREWFEGKNKVGVTAVRKACAAAAVSITQNGAQSGMPSEEELEEFLAIRR